MKNVSSHFTQRVMDSVKQYDYQILVSWSKEIIEKSRFFTLDSSELDGPDPLWSGNQDVISFMDRYDYVVETDRCISWQTSHKISNNPWGLVRGIATIVLNNASGRYFPDKDPVIGNYTRLPNRAVTIQMSVDGESVNLFRGFTERPETSVVNSTCTLKAYDACSYLADLTSEHEPIVNEPLDYVLRELLLEAGFGIDQFTLEPSLQEEIGYVAPSGQKLETIINDLCEAEQYLIFCDGDGIIRGWNNNHYAVSGTPDWTFDNRNATEMQLTSTAIINDVQVEATPYKPVFDQKFFVMDEPNDDCIVPANGTVEIWLTLKDSKDNTEYAIDYGEITYGEQTAASYYLTNVNQDGSGDDNHEAITLERADNFGDTVKLTFSNSSAIDTYITKVLLYGDSAQQRTYVGEEQRDLGSIRDYGTNPDQSNSGELYKITSKYVQNKEWATTLAANMIIRYSQPFNMINQTNFVVPQMELGDYVTVKIGSTGETKDMLVFGIDRSGGQNASFTQKVYLEERRQGHAFILNTSELDGGDILL